MGTTTRVPVQLGSTKIHYFLSPIIDIGTSSVVYGGFYGTPAIKAAIKQIDKNDVNFYEREITVFVNIKADPTKPSTNVVVLHDWFEDASYYYLAMEKADHNLREFLVIYPSLDRSIKLKIIEDIANGIDFLHDKNILHRDIKPENILLFGDDQDVVAKLGDFGVSRKMSNAVSTNSRGRGTENWMSPEAIIAMHKDEPFETTKYVDIFSLGMIAYFTLSNGQHPFYRSRKHGQNETQNIKDRDVLPVKLVEPAKCYSTIHLLTWMMQKEPVHNRPLIRQVTGHPMFWKPLECLDFICNIARTLNDKDEKECKQVRSRIDGEYTQLYRKLHGKPFDWFPLVDPRLFNRMDGRNSNYRQHSVMSLVECIRDKNEHFKDRLQNLLRDLFEDENGGYSEEKYINYHLALFPDVVIFLFCQFLDQTASYFASLKKRFYKEYKANVDVTLLKALISK